MASWDITKLKTLFDSARYISVVLAQKPHFDAVAASLSLKLALETEEKKVRIVCENQMVVDVNRLVGVDTISSSFGGRNLIISFSDQTQMVDKVSYHMDQGELHLVITPKPEASELDHKKLKFVSGTGQSDVVILVGVEHLEDVGKIYHQNREQFESSTLVSISNKPVVSSFTPHEFHDLDAAAISEIVTHLLDQLGLELDTDSASNLLVGIERATYNFKSPLVSARTFEAAAICLKSGAKRQMEISAADFPPGAIPTTTPLAEVEKAPEIKPQSNGKKAAPADWYEPKIFKGPMLQ